MFDGQKATCGLSSHMLWVEQYRILKMSGLQMMSRGLNKLSIKVMMFKFVLMFSAGVSRRSASGSVLRGSFCKMENGT